MAFLEQPLSQLSLVAAIIWPTFILVVSHVLSGIRELNVKWNANQEYRRRRRAGSNARIIFDSQGRISTETVARCARVDFFDRLVGHLNALGDALAFGNPTLFKFNSSLKTAAEVANRCSQGAHAYLCQTDVDPQLTVSFEATDRLLEELMDRKNPSGDVQAQLNAFKGDVAVLYAVFGAGAPEDATEAVTEALLGIQKSKKGFFGSNPSVPEFNVNPIPQLAKLAKKAKESRSKGTTSGGRLKSLEPVDMIEGVHLRGAGLRFWVVSQRDKLGLSSWRLVMWMVMVLLALGPARFVGHAGAALVAAVAAASLGLEVLSCATSRSSVGVLRRSAPLVLLAVIVVALAMQGFDDPPRNNTELELKPTFLPVPPQYNLRANAQQRFYVPIIYGIMHANLAVICLLPLPVCYYLQARFVARFPSLRWLVPQNPVWMHRMLGYALLGGISVTAMIWLLFQGQQCLSQKASGELGQRACFAFDPASIRNPVDRHNGVDVFVLRFHMVWPLIYFFIPLMIWDKYPEAKEDGQGKREPQPAAEKHSGEDSRQPLVTAEASTPVRKRDRLAALFWRKAPSRGASPSDSDEEVGSLLPRDPNQDTTPRSLAKSLCEAVLAFVWRRIVDVSLLIGAAAGCMLVQEGNIDEMTPAFVPLARALIFLWPLVFVVLVLQTIFKFRAFMRQALGPTLSRLLCLGELNRWSEMMQRSWWEVAYFCHVAAYSLLLAGALVIRLQVFWPAIFTWALYFYDRFMIWRCASSHSTPIMVGAGSSRSSYPVNKGEGAAAEPSHVRLLLRRPPGFQFRAGQWCQLALRQCGSYCGAPECAKPFLQWHAFSLASAENDDFLEFHIKVHGSPELLKGVTDVQLAQKSESVANVSEKGNCYEWLFPHRVPCSSDLSRGSYGVQRSGIYLNLTGKDSSGSAKLLRPQLQWTGRLWNVVQWLLECQSAGRPVEQQQVSIMGPYGTMPFTASSHRSLMLIGAGVGFPSTGSMLRQLLSDNLQKQAGGKTAVCFIWTATNVDQLLLCFPSLLADLARYVSESSLDDLKSWLTVKIFISHFQAGDFLDIDPGEHIFPDSKAKKGALHQVRAWLLGQDGAGHDEDGTYICEGSLGASFADVLRKSVFIRDEVVKPRKSLGVCFCGPTSLGNWIRADLSNTILPIQVEYNAECAGD